MNLGKAVHPVIAQFDAAVKAAIASGDPDALERVIDEAREKMNGQWPSTNDQSMPKTQ